MTRNGAVIRGKVAQVVAEAEAISRNLQKAARIRVRATHVGTGKPRYVLIEPPEWPGEP